MLTQRHNVNIRKRNETKAKNNNNNKKRLRHWWITCMMYGSSKIINRNFVMNLFQTYTVLKFMLVQKELNNMCGFVRFYEASTRPHATSRFLSHQ